MSNPKIAYILGNPASGKSTLRGLLDGHPALAVSPIQSMLMPMLVDLDRDFEFRDAGIPEKELFDTLSFRRNLADTGYYKIEAVQEGNPRTATTKSLQDSADEKHQALEGFNFYTFEESWKQKINTEKNFTVNNLYFTIFKEFFQQWGAYEINFDSCEYIVGTGLANRQTITWLLNNYDNSKVLIIDRDPRGILCARGKLSNVYDIESKMLNGKAFDFVEYSKFAHKMKNRYPQRVKIINFRRLILDHESIIGEVTDFLDINSQDILTHSTLAGERLASNNTESRVGEINDDWRDVLNNREKQIIGLQIGEENLTDCSVTAIRTYIESIISHRLSPYENLVRRAISKAREANKFE